MQAARLVFPVGLLLSACTTAPDIAADIAADRAGVMAVADRLVQAINAYDADTIASLFDKDATLFQPIGAPPRYVGIEAIGKSFHERFDIARAAGQTQTVAPKRPQVQFFGDTAILTFELGDLPTDPNAPGRLSRRTVVMHRYADGWRIVHLHGSNIPVNQPAPAQ